MLERDNWTCQTCGRYGNECDHKTPLQHGGDAYGDGNLQTLCRGCHIAKTALENTPTPDPARVEWLELVQAMIEENVV